MAGLAATRKEKKKAGRARSRRTQQRKGTRSDIASGRRREELACADALASSSTRRGEIFPSAPARQAEGGTSPSPSEALQAAAPRPTSRPSPSPCRSSGPWRRREKGRRSWRRQGLQGRIAACSGKEEVAEVLEEKQLAEWRSAPVPLCL